MAVLAIVALAFAFWPRDEEQSSENSGAGEKSTDDAGEKSGADTSMSSLPYFEPENQSRYDAYLAQNATLAPDDAVWMVNANLDKVRYVDYVVIPDPSDLNVLVNKYNQLPADYVPDDLVEIDQTKMKAVAAEALRKMQADAKTAGLTFIAQSGYRSYSYQNGLYEGYKKTDPEGADTYSARPGFSEHQTGLAVDINKTVSDLSDFVGTPEADWVYGNAYRYGFIVRYTEANTDITGYMSEPWHIRYIGVAHATKMHDEGIDSYEEYAAKHMSQ
jgi:D-alanyl-D-alanine carboxypeptidase